MPFLAARAEVYGNLMILFLFPLSNLIVGAQIVFVCIWWGAASSKLNRHFPFVVTVMISNTPWNRSRAFKRRLWRKHPEDLLPSATGALAAHMGTVMEFTLPLLLLVAPSGPLLTIAVVGMVIFHVHIFSTFPLAVPLEWNVFMIFGILFLFGHYGGVPLSTLDDPLLIAILAVTCVGIPVLGNFRPDLDLVPALDALLRRQLGDEPVAVRKGVGRRGEARQLDREGRADRRRAAGEILRPRHGRAVDVQGPRVPLDARARPRAERPAATRRRRIGVECYDVREGEVVAGVVLGYNFGDGHFHNEQLLEAVQERCEYRAG